MLLLSGESSVALGLMEALVVPLFGKLISLLHCCFTFVTYMQSESDMTVQEYTDKENTD